MQAITVPVIDGTCALVVSQAGEFAPPPGIPQASLLSAFAVLALALAYDNFSVLDHPTRQRIYEHLLRLPGDHFRSIVRTLQLSFSTGRHHLDTLEREGYVRRVKVNERVRYYPNGRDAEAQMNQLYAKHWDYRDLRLRVLLAVRRVDRASPSTIGRALGISRQLAAYHLSCLEETGHVRREAGRYVSTKEPRGGPD